MHGVHLSRHHIAYATHIFFRSHCTLSIAKLSVSVSNVYLKQIHACHLALYIVFHLSVFIIHSDYTHYNHLGIFMRYQKNTAKEALARQCFFVQKNIAKL